MGGPVPRSQDARLPHQRPVLPVWPGPRWADLVETWRESQADPARLKTFVNDRLAEPWEDAAMRAVKHNAIADRAEPTACARRPLACWPSPPRWTRKTTAWPCRSSAGAPAWLLGAGLHRAHGRNPADDTVWVALTELLNRPIEHASGATLRVQAYAHDMGDAAQAVKSYVRQRLVQRPMAIFGATANNAPVLGKPKLQDVNWRVRPTSAAVTTCRWSAVAAKHWLYGRLSTDAEKAAEDRVTHFSEDLDPSYFAGLVSETYDPRKNRFEKRRGARNEPLDTWVYAYAAAHRELRLPAHARGLGGGCATDAACRPSRAGG